MKTLKAFTEACKCCSRSCSAVAEVWLSRQSLFVAHPPSCCLLPELISLPSPQEELCTPLCCTTHKEQMIAYNFQKNITFLGFIRKLKKNNFCWILKNTFKNTYGNFTVTAKTQQCRYPTAQWCNISLNSFLLTFLSTSRGSHSDKQSNNLRDRDLDTYHSLTFRLPTWSVPTAALDADFWACHSCKLACKYFWLATVFRIYLQHLLAILWHRGKLSLKVFSWNISPLHTI